MNTDKRLLQIMKENKRLLQIMKIWSACHIVAEQNPASYSKITLRKNREYSSSLS